MAEKLKKILFACWVLWILVFCLATFTKVGFFEDAKSWFLMIVGTVHFFYLYLTKEGGLKWVFFACSIVFLVLFIIFAYGALFKW